jgi:hypothetical protein
VDWLCSLFAVYDAFEAKALAEDRETGVFRSPGLTKPLRLLPGDFSGANVLATFLNVTVHSTLSPANTVGSRQSTNTRMFVDIIPGHGAGIRGSSHRVCGVILVCDGLICNCRCLVRAHFKLTDVLLRADDPRRSTQLTDSHHVGLYLVMYKRRS